MSHNHHCLYAETLMSLLFEATALDFELSIENSSFLDSTWTIPVRGLVYCTVRGKEGKSGLRGGTSLQLSLFGQKLISSLSTASPPF